MEFLPKQYVEVLEHPEGDIASRLGMEGSYGTGDVDEEILQAEFESLLLQLQIEALQRRKDEARLKIRELEQGGKEEESLRFLGEFQKIAMEVDRLKR